MFFTPLGHRTCTFKNPSHAICGRTMPNIVLVQGMVAKHSANPTIRQKHIFRTKLSMFKVRVTKNENSVNLTCQRK